jgi:autotransporter passenger strand-loop-strand repeat protein
LSTHTISSGVTSSNFDIASGHTVRVASGGVALDVNVDAGAILLGPGLIGGVEDRGLVKGANLLAEAVLDVFSGALASGDQIYGHETVNFSGSARGEHVRSGGLLQVMGGAFESGASVASGASEIDFGSATGDDIRQGGSVTVEFGASASNEIVDGGVVTVLFEGFATGDVVSDGGAEVVDQGGFDSNAKVQRGGALYLAGQAANDLVSSGGALFFGGALSGGQTLDYAGSAVTAATTLGGVALSSGARLYLAGVGVGSGAILKVEAGARADLVKVLSGGSGLVSAGGLVVSANIAAGGVLMGAGAVGDASVSGVLTRVTVDGVASVESDGKAVSVSVASGGQLTIDAGGVASNSVVLSGARLALGFEGTAVGDVVSSGGELLYGGNVSGVLLDPGAVSARTVFAGVTLSSGAILAMSGAEVLSGATLSLASGAPAASVFVDFGARLNGPGAVASVFDAGLVSGVAVASGGVVSVLSGAAAQRISVLDGGVEILSSGASGSGDSIKAGGTLRLLGGATATAESVSSGGTLAFEGTVSAGQTIVATASEKVSAVVDGVKLAVGAALQVSGATVLSRGVVSLTANAPGPSIVNVLSGGLLVGAGPLREAIVGGTVSGVTLESGGFLEVMSGGVMKDVTLQADAFVDSGAIVSGGTIAFGVFEQFQSGATAKGQLVSSGGGVTFVGQLTVASGKTFVAGAVSSTTVMDGMTFDSGARFNVANATVSSGGVLMLGDATGVGPTVTVQSGGLLKGPGVAFNIDDFGVVSGIVAAASLVVEAGAIASHDLIHGSMLVRGIATRETISGDAQVAAHGVTSGSILASGGTEQVASGGLAAATVVSAGGNLTVSAGGAVSGGLTLAGGAAVISGAMKGGQWVKFAPSGGVLGIDNLAGFQAAISGLHFSNQKIDLAGFKYASGETPTWTQSGTSGTLTVTAGGKTATLTLIGAYVASDFKLNGDGHGGTIIAGAAAPSAGSLPARFAQGAAGLHGGRYQGGLAVSPSGASAMQPPHAVTVATSGG